MLGPRAGQAKPVEDAPTHDVGRGAGWLASQRARVFASIRICADVVIAFMFTFCVRAYVRMDVDF